MRNIKVFFILFSILLVSSSVVSAGLWDWVTGKVTSEEKEPYCGAIGSRSEGWYQNGELIAYTYCNGCVAECKVTETKSEGWYSSCNSELIKYDTCGEVKSCWSGKDCLTTQFCEFGGCLAETGTCVDVPEYCLELQVGEEVCGCDDKTYPSDCYRKKAKISKAYDDKCKEIQCTDSDGGNNYYVKGTAYGPNTNSIYNNVDLTDNCYGPNNALTEYYCENGQTTYDYYTCQNGCKDGACLDLTSNCRDLDGGINYYKAGNREIFGGDGVSSSTIEYCIDAYTIKELYCNYPVSDYKCPNGCVDGACLEEPEIKCTDSDGGINYYVKGYVEMIGDPTFGTNGRKYDICWDDRKHLSEYVCENGVYKGDHSYICPQSCKDGACIKEKCRDETYSCTIEDIPCCEGLKRVPLASETEDGQCIAASCGSICRPCGNGICDSNENKCNCPEDCKEPNKCSSNSDCEVIFSNCLCGSACDLKTDEPRYDCDRWCGEEIDKRIPKCSCENEKCVSHYETKEPIKCSNEGRMCGGIAGIQCCPDLTCKYEADYPDASGACIKEEIISKCDNGCVSKNNCIPYGTRLKVDDVPKYCDITKKFIEQRKEEMSCQNNYECLSNVCVNNECISAGLIQKMINWFVRLFGG